MIKRRDFLKRSLATPALAAGVGSGLGVGLGAQSADALGNSKFKGKNVILFITDQERAVMHFPSGWARRNMPATQRLLKNGISFENAFCNTCMCSPSRSTMMTGFFPAQHGVTQTLSFGFPNSPAEPTLPTDLPNLGTAFKAAGYNVVYKGKWHLSKPAADPDDIHAYTTDDLKPYGFDRWNPPEAGGSTAPEEFGGGRAANDRRYMRAKGGFRQGNEGAITYLKRAARGQSPFFMVVSLVNPHDVLAYPRTWQSGGYRSNRWIRGPIKLPQTVNENLNTKPQAQRQSKRLFALGMGATHSRQRRLRYLNFYANLIKESDRYLRQILDTLDDLNLTDDTLVIKTSDHGEMGMAHGGLRQKAFNFYEETLRVPLIYSNPKIYPRRKTSKALVSHVDFLPTMANLFGVPGNARAKWQGKSYHRQVAGRPGGVQNYIVFTYDDIYMAQDATLDPPLNPVPPPNRIRSIRERRYKLAEYYDADGVEASEWEMYDLKKDPLERNNLARPGYKRTKAEEAQFNRLKKKLAAVQAGRLQPL